MMPGEEGNGLAVKARLLVVEDDAEMRGLLQALLEAEDYEVQCAGDSSAAISEVVKNEPDLVLLDIMLGEEDGRTLLGEIRRISDLPVVFLTGRAHEIDRIAGLKMGADDYVVKPFSAGELAARVESVLRRSRRSSSVTPATNNSQATAATSGIHVGVLDIDPVTREVKVGDRVVDLTAREFDLLLFLAKSPRQVFSRAQLLDHVWASSSDWQTEATVTEHIRRLRRKIEADPDNPVWITTVRGVGYRFEPSAGSGPASP
jgi:DNA-binding response OmpR family regulator